ncbi:MAG: hypothetical protein JW700_00390, partial [Candidatus Aenigmarchaeota archaeon]|nr:hypothetical protein [Candidatus Aenigmarchaeota archaeon]
MARVCGTTAYSLTQTCEQACGASEVCDEGCAESMVSSTIICNSNCIAETCNSGNNCQVRNDRSTFCGVGPRPLTVRTCNYDSNWAWRDYQISENTDARCSDNIDNDCDGYTDCLDSDCIGRANCCQTNSDCGTYRDCCVYACQLGSKECTTSSWYRDNSLCSGSETCGTDCYCTGTCSNEGGSCSVTSDCCSGQDLTCVGGICVKPEPEPGPCTHNFPTVTISGYQTGCPGDSLTYTVTVRNNDVSECPSSVFQLSHNSFTSWSIGFSGGSTLTIPPQSTRSTSITYTSPLSASNGNYQVRVTATNTVDSYFSSYGTSRYTVDNSVCGGCDNDGSCESSRGETCSNCGDCSCSSVYICSSGTCIPQSSGCDPIYYVGECGQDCHWAGQCAPNERCYQSDPDPCDASPM